MFTFEHNTSSARELPRITQSEVIFGDLNERRVNKKLNNF